MNHQYLYKCQKTIGKHTGMIKSTRHAYTSHEKYKSIKLICPYIFIIVSIFIYLTVQTLFKTNNKEKRNKIEKLPSGFEPGSYR